MSNSAKLDLQRIILDTDLGSDCDDAGALAVLHALADTEEAEILACIYSSGRNPYGAGCIAAINSYYGRPDIPIGSSEASDLGDPRNDFLEAIATNTSLYGHSIVSRSDALDLVSVYRRALAEAPDNSVCIVSIGHTKGLYDLLESPPDSYSSLTGEAFVEQKVKNWVCMAGEFPVESEASWNFGKNGASHYSRSVVERWPTPIVFSGFEIGSTIQTGTSLAATPTSNPVREAYRLWHNALLTGRASWDQTAVLFAARSAGEYWELSRGRCIVDDTGRTEWRPDSHGQHAYLVEKMKSSDVAAVIEDLMCRAPVNKLPAGNRGGKRLKDDS